MGQRNVGVAMDFSAFSKAALRWASTNLVRGGDRLVLLHVNSSYQIEHGIVHLWEQDGSRMIIFFFLGSDSGFVSGVIIFLLSGFDDYLSLYI
jgi:Universal stress protein family